MQTYDAAAAIEIDDEQIAALRTEAGAHGDREQVALCDRALSGDEAARAECARVIAKTARESAAECPSPGTEDMMSQTTIKMYDDPRLTKHDPYLSPPLPKWGHDRWRRDGIALPDDEAAAATALWLRWLESRRRMGDSPYMLPQRRVQAGEMYDLHLAWAAAASGSITPETAGLPIRPCPFAGNGRRRGHPSCVRDRGRSRGGTRGIRRRPGHVAALLGGEYGEYTWLRPCRVRGVRGQSPAGLRRASAMVRHAVTGVCRRVATTTAPRPAAPRESAGAGLGALGGGTL
jgi:hypothetical protein